MRSADLRGLALRVRVAGTILLGFFVLLGVRAAQLALHNPDGEGTGRNQIETVLKIPSSRGAILDRSGAALAVSVQAPSVYAVPQRVQERRATARALAEVLDDDPARIESRLAMRSPFVFIARWIDVEQADAIRELGLPGVDLVDEPRRRYPHRALAGHYLGYANIDGIGQSGIEQMQDAWLRGEAQTLEMERDGRRRILATAGLDPRQASGGDLLLTLDAALQADSEAALETTVKAHGAQGGAVVVIDPRNGDLLALAERPAFDPNAFRSTAFRDARARSFLDAFEPGSTAKPFVVAGAIEAGVLTADEPIDTEGGRIRVPGRVFRDLHPEDGLDVSGVLRVSSNVGAVKIGQRLGRAAHHATLQRFGFGARSGAGFPGESAGLLRNPGDWRPVDHATISFGQGFSVTPVQLAFAMAALATDGTVPRPRLIAARRRPGEAWQAAPVRPGRRAISPEVARSVRAMLTDVVDAGTGRRAGLRDVSVAGKTGTAQKLDLETGSYSQSDYVAWFVGAAPAGDPKLVVVVMIDGPEEIHGGGAVAAPVFAEVAAAQLAREGIATAPQLPRDTPLPAQRRRPEPRAEAPRLAETPTPTAPPAAREPELPEPDALDVAAGPRTLPTLERLGERVLLPDFQGLGPEDVKRITAASDLEVEIVGAGRAVGQDPAPGTVVRQGDTRVRVRFSKPPLHPDRTGARPGGGEG